MQYGTSRSRVLRLPPARLSRMMRKLSWDACVNCGLPAHSPIAQTLGAVDSNRSVAMSVQLDAGLVEPDAGGIGNASCCGQDIAAFDLLLTGGRTHGKADLLSGSALHIEGFGCHQNLNTFVTENSLHFVGDVGILTGHQLRPGLDDRHAAAEAAISLGHFETDIATAEHDEMRRQVVELQRLDMGERPGGIEAGNARNCRVRTDIEENLVARQHACAAVIEAYLKRLRRHKAPGPHDQLAAGCLVEIN